MSKARQLADLGNAYSDGALSNRNAIINGNFDIWQRGTNTASNGFVADRWVFNVAGPSGTITQSRQSFSVGQTDVPNEPKYFYRAQGSSYTMTAANITQRIEDVRTFAGQLTTISFYAKASSARDIRLRFLQEFDGSSAVDTEGSTFSLTTSWQRFVDTVSLPSISGKTVGANSRLDMTLDIKEGAFGSNLNSDSIDIAQVQLEVGDTATPFEHRSYGDELARCQRYYQRWTNPSGDYGVVATGLSNNTATFARMTVTLKQEMRAAPSSSYSNLKGYDGVAVITPTSVTAYSVANNFAFDMGGSGITANRGAVALIGTAAGSYFALDAEL